MENKPKGPSQPPFALGNPQGRATDPRFDMALRNLGFDGARDPRAKPIANPVVATGPKVDGAMATALARRDWLLATQERQRGLSQLAGGLLRCEGVESQQFLDLFYAPGRPVVITGGIADWPALARWTPDYLRAAIGEAPVEFQGNRGAAGDFELAKDRHKQVLPFGAYLDMILANPGNDAYLTAYNSAANAAALAPLMADTRPVPALLGPGQGMLWIGSAETFTPLHFDLTNNLLIQITGRKRILLVPPSETRFLAHRRHVFSDVHDLESESQLQRHPQARAAKRFEVVLSPGEMLFIPIGWWHQVRSLDFSVMMTCTNFLWPNAGHQDFPQD